MPQCHCGSGEKIQYICTSKECEYLKSLNNPLSYKRYFCDSCMYDNHNHRPVKIYSTALDIGSKWQALDMKLHNIEHDFFTNMKEYAPLLAHFDDVAKSKNLSTENTANSKMQELDKVKEGFTKDYKDKDADSINELIQGYKIIELIEIKEALR